MAARSVPARRAASQPRPAWGAVSNASAAISGANNRQVYAVATASANAAAAATSHPVAGSLSPARITHQAASATRNSDIASVVANAPRCSVVPSTANRAVAKNEARRPNSRAAVPQSRIVAPSMNARDRTRAPASPPRLSATAPSGG